MVSRKYRDDYRLENVKRKDGRVVTTVVYKGELFVFKKAGEELKKIKRIFILTTVIEWVVFFLSLFLNTDKGRVVYISLPLIAIAFPLLGQSDVLLLLLKDKKGYTRLEKDRITERLVSFIFISFFFSLCSLIGHIVHWIKYTESIEEAILLILTVLLTFLSFNLFLKRKDLEMKSLEVKDGPKRD